jgi:serine/threonine protein kinase
LRLEQQLRSGKLTEIWRARSSDHGDCVAKFPRPGCASHRGVRRLIEREFDYLERAAGDGVVPALGLLEAADGPVLLTRWLEGGDLVSAAGSHPRHWAAAAVDVAVAVQRIHDLGFVHGDIKPRNVLLDARGRGTLIDFGDAAAVGARRSGGGTVAYQSLALRHGGLATPADDVHGFAAMIYELLCGALPFGLAPSIGDLERVPKVPGHIDAAPALRALLRTALSPAGAACEGALDGFRSTLQAMITP